MPTMRRHNDTLYHRYWLCSRNCDVDNDIVKDTDCYREATIGDPTATSAAMPMDNSPLPPCLLINGLLPERLLCEPPPVVTEAKAAPRVTKDFVKVASTSCIFASDGAGPKHKC